MKRKPHSTSLVLLLMCIFTFWWGVSVLAQRSVPEQSVIAATQTQPEVSPAAGTPLMVTESANGNTFTYNGTYQPQNPCDSFGSGIQYNSASDGGHVVVVILTKPSATACAEAASVSPGQPFSVSMQLSTNTAPIFDGVLVNGAPIPARLTSGY